MLIHKYTKGSTKELCKRERNGLKSWIGELNTFTKLNQRVGGKSSKLLNSSFTLNKNVKRTRFEIDIGYTFDHRFQNKIGQ